MSGKGGEFLVDGDGRSFWSTSASAGSKPAEGQIDSGSQQATQSGWKVEKYTGELTRDDDLVKKPVAAMSFG